MLALTCRLCNHELARYEQPEGICDSCLHANQWGYSPRADPAPLREPDPPGGVRREGTPQRLLFSPLEFTPIRSK